MRKECVEPALHSGDENFLFFQHLRTTQIVDKVAFKLVNCGSNILRILLRLKCKGRACRDIVA